jgi:pimeloyl-ACP methyl ester carboxylesterase
MSTSDTATELQAIVKKIYRVFFSPAKYEVKPADQAVLDRGDNYRLPFAGGELAVTTWGSAGPAVLLMHGWGGSRAQMTGFVDPLLAAGYRVVGYDQPAHGESDGKMTNLLEIAPTMDLIRKQEGDFYAIIAHSFGTLITSFALAEQGFSAPQKLVYFGSFHRLMDSLPRFQTLTKLPDLAMQTLRLMMDENFGRERLESISHDFLAPRINIPLLMFHDTTDDVTPIEDSRAIARIWNSAWLTETSGLGHRGALRSREIHQQVIEFLKS